VPKRAGDRTVRITLGPLDDTRRDPIEEPKVGQPLTPVEARVLASRMMADRARGTDLQSEHRAPTRMDYARADRQGLVPRVAAGVHPGVARNANLARNLDGARPPQGRSRARQRRRSLERSEDRRDHKRRRVRHPSSWRSAARASATRSIEVVSSDTGEAVELHWKTSCPRPPRSRRYCKLRRSQERYATRQDRYLREVPPSRPTARERMVPRVIHRLERDAVEAELAGRSRAACL
jgi:hypothetical protein